MKKCSFWLIAILSILSCKKNDNGPEPSFLLFPAGRSFLGTSQIKVSINNKEYKPDTLYDSCGGYWLKIQKADLPGNGNISIEYKRKTGELYLFKETTEDKQKWLTESYYIDWNSDVLKSKAIELTKDYRNNIIKQNEYKSL